MTWINLQRREKEREKFEISMLPRVPSVIPDGMPTEARIQVDAPWPVALSLLPFSSLPFLFFATSNSYSDINGRARLAARHYGVPRAKTSRKMLEFMLAFAHLPPHPFSSLSMALSLSLSPSHPLSLSLSRRPAIHLFFHFLLDRSTWNLTRPPQQQRGCSSRVRKLFAVVHCSTSFLPLSYLLLSAIEHRLPPHNSHYPVKYTWTLSSFRRRFLNPRRYT